MQKEGGRKEKGERGREKRGREEKGTPCTPLLIVQMTHFIQKLFYNI